MTPPPVAGTGKPEFRRWYRGELVRAHGYFAVAFLAMITVAVCVEAIDWQLPLGELPTAIVAMAGVVLCVVSIRRYSVIIRRAEGLAAEHEGSKT